MYVFHFNPNLCQYNVHLSIDFIFSNWLLMYLSDQELHNFIKKSISWLRPGGFLFFRESCNHRSGSDATSKPQHHQPERDSEATILIPFFFLSRWHKEGIQSYTLPHWCTIQPPGFLSRHRGPGGWEEIWLRHCSEKESSGLYRGNVLSNEDKFACVGVSKNIFAFYFPRWKTTQTRSAGCWRRFPALQTPRADSAPSSSSWIISSTPAVVSSATRRCLGLVTSAREGPAPPRCQVGDTPILYYLLASLEMLIHWRSIILYLLSFY